VPRRVDIDQTLPSVMIPGRIFNELCAHVLETLPEECCGLIVGGEQERFRHLIRCRNEMTARHQRDPANYPRDGCEAFYMNELDYARIQRQADASGERVTAVYHSHVGVGAYLSETDLEYAQSAHFPFSEADQIVVAVFDRKIGELGLFQRDGLGGTFTGRGLTSGGP
jgi:proteasome lid subunit RPN8/RPN11